MLRASSRGVVRFYGAMVPAASGASGVEIVGGAERDEDGWKCRVTVVLPRCSTVPLDPPPGPRSVPHRSDVERKFRRPSFGAARFPCRDTIRVRSQANRPTTSPPKSPSKTGRSGIDFRWNRRSRRRWTSSRPCWKIGCWPTVASSIQRTVTLFSPLMTFPPSIGALFGPQIPSKASSRPFVAEPSAPRARRRGTPPNWWSSSWPMPRRW